MTFRMYYDGLILDPKLPEPAPVVEINVPNEKPAPMDSAAVMRTPGTVHYGIGATLPAPGTAVIAKAAAPRIPTYIASEESPEERLKIIREVNEYMEVLKKFDGIIHNDFLAKRKRQLFEALPSVPPSAAERIRSRQRTS